MPGRGGTIALAVFATVASAQTAAYRDATGCAQANYELVFGMAAVPAVVIAAVGAFLPQRAGNNLSPESSV